jgi:hypothetical protein
MDQIEPEVVKRMQEAVTREKPKNGQVTGDMRTVVFKDTDGVLKVGIQFED